MNINYTVSWLSSVVEIPTTELPRLRSETVETSSRSLFGEVDLLKLKVGEPGAARVVDTLDDSGSKGLHPWYILYIHIHTIFYLTPS